MSIKSLEEEIYCFHLEKRVVERVSRGVHFDKRPDLVLWVCHFPLPSLSGIQCPVLASGDRCPHNGPYSNN
ncbi:MAG: hypothetical protein OEZ31_01205 [Nitrospirota bacterium]|nr:hypothetical protein [Nitrospirota bacterium]MDH5767564.1 hypothetical protein [Nitrospirota bacterium]